MKKFTFVASLSLSLGIALFSCQSDNRVNPHQNGPSLAADSGDVHVMPSPQCGPVVTLNLCDDNGSTVDENGDAYGTVDILNDPDNIFLMIGTNNGRYVSGYECWKGENNNVPNDGNKVMCSSFGLKNQLNPVLNRKQIVIPRSALGAACTNWCLHVNSILVDDFGDVVAGSETSLWMKGATPFMNTWLASYCWASCLNTVEGDEACATAYSYAGSTGCTKLSLNPVGGVAPYTYSWSNGATTREIQVCPTATTVYTGIITDASGTSTSVKYTVNVMNIACGNDNRKVTVCHIPPGNPANPQEICIDASALPAHIADFRTDGDNPRLGHDSGCHLGPCSANPCQN